MCNFNLKGGGLKKEKGVVVAKEWDRFQGNWPQYSKKQSKNTHWQTGKQNSSHHPPGGSNTLAWIERILHGGLLFLSNCLGLRDLPPEL